MAQFAYAKVLQNVHSLGSPAAVLRMAKYKAGPVVTDNGNFVIDAPFPEEMMRDPYALLTRLKMLTGVVEVGLFCHMAKAAYFGNQDGSVTVKWHDGRIETVDSCNTPLPRPVDAPEPHYPGGGASLQDGEKKDGDVKGASCGFVIFTSLIIPGQMLRCNERCRLPEGLSQKRAHLVDVVE